MNLHISTEFERELQSIKTLVSEMGALAQSMIEGAIEGFENADAVLLNQIFESEKRVDQLELEIERFVTMSLLSDSRLQSTCALSSPR